MTDEQKRHTTTWDDFHLVVKLDEPERLDKRHKKLYGLRLRVTGWVEWEGDEWVFCRLDRELENVFKPLRAEVDSSHGWGSRRDEKRSGYVTVHLPLVQVEKPSLIPTEEEAWGNLGLTFEKAAQKIQLALTRAHAAWNEMNELEDRAAQANAVRPWASKIICKQAKEEVDFSNRLAALHQELKERAEELVESRREELAASLATSDWREEGVRFHPRAIEVGLEKGLSDAVSFCSSVRSSVFPGRSSSHSIAPEDVK